MKMIMITLLRFFIFLSFSGSPVEMNGARGVVAAAAGGEVVSPLAFSSALRALRASRFSFCLIACFDGAAKPNYNISVCERTNITN